MKIKQGYELENRSGVNVVVCKDNSIQPLDNSIVLTDTAVFLWNLLKTNDLTKAELLNAVIENFDVSTVFALGNIDIFVNTMKENGIIE